MAHVRTMKHLQMEQIHQLQKRAEGNTSQTEIGDIFQVIETTGTAEESSAATNEHEPKGTVQSAADEAGRSSRCYYDLCSFAAGAPAAHDEAAAAAEGDEETDSTRPHSNNAETGDSTTEESRSCPLCSEKFPSQDRLESHAMSVHSVNSEGLQRLQSLINGSHWLNKKEGKKMGLKNHF